MAGPTKRGLKRVQRSLFCAGIFGPLSMKFSQTQHCSLWHGFLCLALFAFVVIGPRAHGQLIWGSGGNGGSGTWNSSLTDWWNGSSNVTWTNGDSATFAGTGGTVDINYIGMTTT